jgi:hypothetical protein
MRCEWQMMADSLADEPQPGEVDVFHSFEI